MDQIDYVTLETFAGFKNVDRTILKLNKTLERYGYRFQAVSIEELERNFSSLFNLKYDSRSIGEVSFEGSEIKLSRVFYEALLSSPWESEAALEKEIFLLKRILDFEVKIINRSIDLSQLSTVSLELSEFLQTLVQSLRLFKPGDVCHVNEFQISKEERKLIQIKHDRRGRIRGLRKLTLSDAEAAEVGEFFKRDLKYFSSLEVALSNFSLSYETFDAKTRFIVLMTSLEGIFNQGTEQIGHTLARHLALTVSLNIEEFHSNYKRIKKLYRIRSAIVHGDALKENIFELIFELEDLVRKALVYCQEHKLKKEEIFAHFNSMGFNSSLPPNTQN